MSSLPEKGLPHSAEYLGEYRDYWWPAEFVSLIARSWGLVECRRVLDVGCGVGHWGRVLLPHIGEDARLVGLDREPEWVARATAIAGVKGLSARANYVVGDAGELPFADGEFDLVTCQTLLIHVADPGGVMREMARVLCPGGRVLAVEPNNMAASQIVGSARFNEPAEQRLAMTRFQLLCERGKAALGEGDNSIGEVLPGLFLGAGLRDVRVCQAGTASELIPPYDTPAQRTLRDQILDWVARDIWIWSKQDTRRYFVAGGGEVVEFEVLWARAMALAREECEQLRSGRLIAPGGGVCYVVLGRKASTA